jgi:hypothetical protein
MLARMIRVGPAGAAPPSQGARRIERAEPFRLDGASRTSAGAPAPLAQASATAALLALQSQEGAPSRAKTLAAAKRALDLLDRLRLRLLEGAGLAEELDALARAAHEGAASDPADAGLAAVCEDIALRARVELAKRGR